MKTNDTHFRIRGFSLFEVLIFITISGFLLVSMVSYRVATIRQSRSGYYKIYATRYAEELAEWLRVQKELSWTDFYNKATNNGTAATTTYCANGTINLDSTLNGVMTAVTASNCGYAGITSATPNGRPKIFRRTVTFTNSDTALPIQAAILVEWQEGPNQIFSVPINTTYTY